ncbi:MAG: SDR family oxidoreductase [Chloroherpetonaceae bacterium]|nr:SDR family oxidoreductase [Chloroherpetonaceae bacterium]MDW8438673.1 SDR family oxidoreductase [Chloroherpetonaceae bacterium]
MKLPNLKSSLKGVSLKNLGLKRKRVEPSETSPVCFITGASGRLGKAMALALAERGWRVCFTYRSSRQEALETLSELKALAPDAKMIRCDISKVSSIKRAFLLFRTRFERLDLMICNASNFFPTPLPEVSEKDWDSLVDTNLKGTFFTMQEAAKLMMEQNFVSRMITISDVSAELVWRRYAPYTASKVGVQHLTKVFAKTFAPKILVNSIAPGTVLLNEADKEFEKDILSKIPLRRVGTPSDIVKAMLFLAENDYITGHILSVDGGRLLY